MSESIVDKVMQDWVYSGKLQAMSPTQVEEIIHQEAAEVTARAKTTPAWGGLFPSLALPSQQGIDSLTFGEVGAKSIGEGKAPLTLSPGRQRRGKREFLDEKVLLGPGSPNEKAKLLGVSHMTVRRAIKELKEEEGTHESLGQG